MEFEPGCPLQADLAAGREEAFAALYDRFAARLYRVALTVIRSPSDAEDAVHDAFLAVWSARKSLGHVDNLDAYLFASLRRAAARIVKRRRSQRSSLAKLPCKPLISGQPATDDRLESALGGLPDAQREVLALKIDGGLTFAEIAAILEINANTAASRYRLALDGLRRKLNP